MRTPLRWLTISSLIVLLSSALAARTRPLYGGRLRIEVRQTNWEENDALRPLVLECLTATGAAGEPEPLLATQWESQNGGRRWVFTLRKGVLWHDGTPLTAEGAAAALQSETDGTMLAGYTVRGSGDAIVIEGTQPMANLAAELSLSRFALVRRAQGQTIGTGAFQLSSASRSRMLLSANDSYWGGRPYLDAIEVTTGRSIRSQWLDASVNRADIVTVPAEMLRVAQQEQLHPIASGNTLLVALLATRSGLALDSRLRQALAASIDRASLLNFVFLKQGEIAAAALPNELTGYDALFPSSTDAALARELRSQASPSRPISIGYEAADATLRLVAERIALNARDNGLPVSTDAKGEPDFLLMRLPLPATNRAAALAEFASQAGISQAGGSDAIEDLFRDEHALMAQASLIPLLYVPRAYAVAERIRGAALAASGRLDLSGAWIEGRR
jgi:MarR-like DNA-binding transcriptional regulator SgrR of sgrS sRNA